MAWAHCWRKDSLPSSRSSVGLERKAVSTKMDGTSGARRTAKLASSTRPLCSWLSLPNSVKTEWPSLRLSRRVAVWVMSKMALSTLRLPLVCTPPMASALFWVWARNFAAELVAPLVLSMYTPVPRADGLVKASAWMDTNTSALRARPLATRTPNGIKMSSLRVMNTL